MTLLEIILGVALIIASLVMIIVIILQEGNQQGVGVVSGGADTFFSKNKARSYDAFLARATKWFAIGFVAVVLALNVIAYFAPKADEVTAEEETSVSETADTEVAGDDAATDETAAAEDNGDAATTAAEGDATAAADNAQAAETSQAAE